MRWHKQTVMSGGVRLAVRDSGGHGIPAVLLHGLGTPSDPGTGWRPCWPRAVTAVGMGTRLSFAELRRIADEAAEREDRLEEAYTRLSCPLLVVLAGKAGPVPQGEALLAAVDTAATRLQQRHPQVKLARLLCGHNIPLERPRELADLISRFAETSAAQL